MGQAPDDNKQETEDSKSADDMLRLTSDIVTAYLAHNPLAASDVPAMIKTVHATLGALRGVSAADAANASKPDRKSTRLNSSH